MPNLVHSLDAASLALLLDSYFNNQLKNLDKGIKENIKQIFGDESFNEETRRITVSNINIEFPDIKVVLGQEPRLNFNSLKKSKYILN
ncbi:hypothetical protein F5Y05DRAFT_406999 [Hypoxylon sp. FL0543]|nr:hypothetical protein F5Y05DRAFT_406999 [Hypoxylon sp. FL0543]